MFTPDKLSTEDRALFLEIGPDEVWQRVQNLSSWNRYTTIAQIPDYDRSLTPAQAIAWAKFAESLGRDALVDGHLIKVEKDETAKVRAVLSSERAERARAEREAEKAKAED
jgi:hypothetical protein